MDSKDDSKKVAKSVKSKARKERRKAERLARVAELSRERPDHYVHELVARR